MGLFSKIVVLILFSTMFTACQEADFYEKPELISSDFKDRYEDVDEVPFDLSDPKDPIVIDDPVIEDPIVIEDPVIKDPIVIEDPVIKDPIVIEDPVLEDPIVIEDPVLEDPIVIEDPVLEDPIVIDDPVLEDPIVVDDPVLEDPIVIEDPVVEDPIVEEPVIDYRKVTEEFTQAKEEQTKVDILWVIDDSGSMGDEQDALAYNFDVFINNFLKKDVDFKMAITTTDATQGHIGKDHNNSTFHLTSEWANKNQNHFMHKFEELIKVGVKGSGREKGLLTMEAFLNSSTGKSFLREDAYLMVVHVSDEQEQSSRDSNYYVKYLHSLKKQAGLVKVYSIVNTKKTSMRWETLGTKYTEVSEKTNGTSTHIKEDFHGTLSDIGNSIVDLASSFALAQRPKTSDSIVVLVNGVESSSWSYDSVSNSIKFNDGSVPEAGSEIKISFNVKL